MPEWVRAGFWGPIETGGATREVLALPEPHTTIIADADLTGLAIIRPARSAGLRVLETQDKIQA